MARVRSRTSRSSTAATPSSPSMARPPHDRPADEHAPARRARPRAARRPRCGSHRRRTPRRRRRPRRRSRAARHPWRRSRRSMRPPWFDTAIPAAPAATRDARVVRPQDALHDHAAGPVQLAEEGEVVGGDRGVEVREPRRAGRRAISPGGARFGNGRPGGAGVALRPSTGTAAPSTLATIARYPASHAPARRAARSGRGRASRYICAHARHVGRSGGDGLDASGSRPSTRSSASRARDAPRAVASSASGDGQLLHRGRRDQHRHAHGRAEDRSWRVDLDRRLAARGGRAPIAPSAARFARAGPVLVRPAADVLGGAGREAGGGAAPRGRRGR